MRKLSNFSRFILTQSVASFLTDKRIRDKETGRERMRDRQTEGQTDRKREVEKSKNAEKNRKNDNNRGKREVERMTKDSE